MLTVLLCQSKLALAKPMPKVLVKVSIKPQGRISSVFGPSVILVTSHKSKPGQQTGRFIVTHSNADKVLSFLKKAEAS